MAGGDASGIRRECSGTVDRWKRPRRRWAKNSEESETVGCATRLGLFVNKKQDTALALPSTPDTERGGLC
jgi:hypothetical protein